MVRLGAVSRLALTVGMQPGDVQGLFCKPRETKGLAPRPWKHSKLSVWYSSMRQPCGSTLGGPWFPLAAAKPLISMEKAGIKH